MQFNIVALTAFLATAMAGPVYNPCGPGVLYGVPQCCNADVVDVADLGCSTPSSLPKSPEDFNSICLQVRAAPKCCSVPVAGQALLCVSPPGTV